jgi:hypothetical protein
MTQRPRRLRLRSSRRVSSELSFGPERPTVDRASHSLSARYCCFSRSEYVVANREVTPIEFLPEWRSPYRDGES